jgi:hypothetical protein
VRLEAGLCIVEEREASSNQETQKQYARSDQNASIIHGALSAVKWPYATARTADRAVFESDSSPASRALVIFTCS